MKAITDVGEMLLAMENPDVTGECPLFPGSEGSLGPWHVLSPAELGTVCWWLWCSGRVCWGSRALLREGLSVECMERGHCRASTEGAFFISAKILEISVSFMLILNL